jgi:tRNA modification GTPase
MVELSLHGGSLVPALALDAVLAAGARQALPGEFTRRAVLHGKMDLLEASAVGDLIDSKSRAAHDVALNQLEGGLSRRVAVLRSAILDLEALIAYDIDFPEEDDGPISPREVLRAAQEVKASMETLLATRHVGELVRHGALVVIAGAPNTGKSSLFNALVGSARAMVTEIAGTTRDAIESEIEINGWPVRLVDTAGLRDSTDVLERLGIEISERHISKAQLVLVCGETTVQLQTSLSRIRLLTNAATLAIRTKADLAAPSSEFDTLQMTDLTPDAAVSVHTGEGLATLAQGIARNVSGSSAEMRWDVPILTREEQQRAVGQALQEISEFIDSWNSQSLPATIAAVHLRSATIALDELIGPVGAEDVLDRVFSSFCVGK